MKKLLWLLLLVAGYASGVSSLNDAPYVLRAVPDQTVPAGVPFVLNGYYFIACAPKQGGGSPTWSVTSPPPGTAMGSSNGLLQGSPSGSIVGTRIACLNPSGTVSSNAFNWTVTGAAPSAPPAVGKFVDCSVGINGNGTLANPWNSLANVTGTAQGLDLFLRAGTECTPSTTFVMTWGGTISDGASIDGYFVQSGVAYRNVPTNYTVSMSPDDYIYAQPRPIIRGSYHDSCRISAALNSAPGTKCAWNTADPDAFHKTPGTAIPTSAFAGLLHVNILQYQTIRGLDIRDSAGRGIDATFAGTCFAGQTACENSNLTIEQNRVDLSAGGQSIIVSGVARYTIRENSLSRDNASIADTQPCTRNTGRCPPGDPSPNVSLRGGSSITPDNCAPCVALIENNDIHDSFGEAIGAYDISYVLIRGNRGGSDTVAGFDSGASDQVVQEQNLIMGGTSSDTHISAGEWAGKTAFWGLAFENGGGSGVQSGTPGRKWVVRNNLCSLPDGACFNEYSNAAAGNTTNPTQISSYFLGNTAISNSNGTTLNLNFSAPQFLSATGVDVVNNLFVYNGSATCASAPSSSLVRWHHNQHTVSPSDVECRTPGTGDVYSTNHGIVTSMTTFLNSSWLLKVSPGQFIPSGGAGANAGIAYTSTILDTGTTWDYVLANRKWLPPAPCAQTTQTPKSEWVKGLPTNYCGVPRTATPNMGAF